MNTNRKQVALAIFVLASLLAACTQPFSQTATPAPAVVPPAADLATVQPTTTLLPTAKPTESTGETPKAQPTATKVLSTAVSPTQPAQNAGGFSPECTFLNWMPDQAKYKIEKGYSIPLTDLEKLAGDAFPGIIYFEGDDYGKTEHHVAVVDGGVRTSQGTFKDGNFLFKDGAFWACPSDAETLVPQDEIVATSLWKKWKNLHDEGKTMRLCVYQTTGVTCFEPGNEPNLLNTAVLEAGYHDCDDNVDIAEQTPYGFQKSGDLLTAHAGASNCRTLFVGELTVGGNTVAVYFSGARNGFQYVDGGRFWLVPTAWGLADMQDFVTKNFTDLKVTALQ